MFCYHFTSYMYLRHFSPSACSCCSWSLVKVFVFSPLGFLLHLQSRIVSSRVCVCLPSLPVVRLGSFTFLHQQRFYSFGLGDHFLHLWPSPSLLPKNEMAGFWRDLWWLMLGWFGQGCIIYYYISYRCSVCGPSVHASLFPGNMSRVVSSECQSLVSLRSGAYLEFVLRVLPHPKPRLKPGSTCDNLV